MKVLERLIQFYALRAIGFLHQERVDGFTHKFRMSSLAAKVLDEMDDSGTAPDIKCYNTAISAQVGAQGFEQALGIVAKLKAVSHLTLHIFLRLKENSFLLLKLVELRSWIGRWWEDVGVCRSECLTA